MLTASLTLEVISGFTISSALFPNDDIVLDFTVLNLDPKSATSRSVSSRFEFGLPLKRKILSAFVIPASLD